MKFELTTDRLILKVLTPDYAPQVLDFYLHNASVFENYEPIVADNFYTIEHQNKVLSFEYKNTIKLNMIRYFIYKIDDPDKIIGTISYRNIIRPIYACATLGYKMDKDFTLKGYCQEAILATLPLLKEELGLHRIEALVMPDNTTSIHILQKLGFTEEGLLKDKVLINEEWKDHYLYTKLFN